VLVRTGKSSANQSQAISRAEKDTEREFNNLVKRFRKATDSKKAERLGEQLGRMIFGR
jgi:hypothetical protein